eukprot:5438429-Pyramimonas_sp.AAC.1
MKKLSEEISEDGRPTNPLAWGLPLSEEQKQRAQAQQQELGKGASTSAGKGKGAVSEECAFWQA